MSIPHFLVGLNPRKYFRVRVLEIRWSANTDKLETLILGCYLFWNMISIYLKEKRTTIIEEPRK